MIAAVDTDLLSESESETRFLPSRFSTYKGFVVVWLVLWRTAELKKRAVVMSLRGLVSEPVCFTLEDY